MLTPQLAMSNKTAIDILNQLRQQKVTIGGLSADSRELRPGEVFVDTHLEALPAEAMALLDTQAS